MSPEHLMQLAIEQARLALAHDEVPIGCVIYHHPTGRVIGTGHNRRILDADPTAHAEILAIRAAAKALGDWRLEETTLAVTLEPCPMCAGAIVGARVARLVYGCTDLKAGAVETLYQICTDGRLNHRVAVTGGVMAGECAKLLTDFFAAKRAMGKK
ncbi:MAG TPA: tRNA adenosine(34) deaminase TadA [Tepidisphaeraceae bacterium]|nr:tRNA adenosine(34) deaminase TadA [Tepidisphaeraceae bacterium]